MALARKFRQEARRRRSPKLMPVQLALRFDEVPITCSTQQCFHNIAPCLAGKITPAEQARHLNLSYSTVARWLREFREDR